MTKHQRSEEIEFFFNLNFIQNLTESDINNVNIKSQLEHQFQIQEAKDSILGYLINIIQ